MKKAKTVLQPKPEAEDLILRDHLAIDRTALANERTLLADVCAPRSRSSAPG